MVYCKWLAIVTLEQLKHIIGNESPMSIPAIYLAREATVET